MLQIVVMGIMGRCPFGGQTWLYLNWLRGLHRLGHEVWYVEDDSVWPYDPIKETVTADCSYAVRHIQNSMDRIGLTDSWAFRLRGIAGSSWGLPEAKLDELYSSCDILLNIVGATDLHNEHMTAPMRVYVQTDPVTAELRLAMGDEHTRKAFENHHFIATYGENYGADDCGVPLNGLDDKYVKTRQPIDLELWPMDWNSDLPLFTTIGNFRQEGEDVEYNGSVFHWSKHHEWQKFLSLPNMTEQLFEVALKVDREEDMVMLTRSGWSVVSPVEMSLDVFGAYQAFFRRSRAEFTVAKDQNIRLRSGWFSERDACYLATGKPVIAQDTGFDVALPTGEGLFTFTKIDQVLAAIDEINANYEHHCKSAREIAEEYLETTKVAGELLRNVGY